MFKYIYFLLNFQLEIMILMLICYFLILYLLDKVLNLTILEIMFIALFSCLILFYSAIFNVDLLQENFYYFHNFFMINGFILIVKRIIIFLLFIYLILLKNFNSIIKLPIIEFLILIFVCLFGIFIIISSNHLFVIFLFLELVNLCVYCLIGLNKYSNLGIEIAFKYFVQSSLATLIGVFGISLLYLSAGTLFLNELSIFMQYENLS
jgi:NADH-quinone oxidoreductase subunit N